jgi:ppGpp synthetase/RelA/SpoT-type nucleotidyltranferase
MHPGFGYSKGDVRRAGQIIAANMPWCEENDQKIREAFRIANNWRDTHAVPMHSVRYSVICFMRYAALNGITAARLKRMQAIRRKLQRFNYTLERLQHLGGCRVILPTIADVETLVDRIKHRARHEIREDNYILNPKNDGYRSHHLMLTYQGRGPKEVFTGRKIELQVRTTLQHSWATAIEAVGLFRREELKNNSGSAEWLRLFKLMSAEFDDAEHCPLPPDIPSVTERREEVGQN